MSVTSTSSLHVLHIETVGPFTHAAFHSGRAMFAKSAARSEVPWLFARVEDVRAETAALLPHEMHVSSTVFLQLITAPLPKWLFSRVQAGTMPVETSNDAFPVEKVVRASAAGGCRAGGLPRFDSLTTNWCVHPL